MTVQGSTTPLPATPQFPFTALVGEETMKLALVAAAIHPGIGGVLIRGEKGTAKSTAARSLAALLPEIPVVEGCPFGCDPAGDWLCEGCAARRARGETLPAVYRPVPVVELPLGATEDRVAGTLDLEHAIREGRRRFEPGILAAAHRGILYVDEVNLLDDALVDLLLDVAASGVNRVEREGVSVAHPARFLLIGTMNPEEGELRPQLLDRFGLSVEVAGLREREKRAEAVRRRIAFETDPAGFLRQWAAAEAAERARIAAARRNLPQTRVDDTLLELIVTICTEFQVDGLRADLVIYKTAQALAAYRGRAAATEGDVRDAARLALPHRLRRRPFEQGAFDPQQLDDLIRQERAGRLQRPPAGPAGPGEDSPESPGDPAGPRGRGVPPGGSGPGAAGGPRPGPPPPSPSTPPAGTGTSDPAARREGNGPSGERPWPAVAPGPVPQGPVPPAALQLGDHLPSGTPATARRAPGRPGRGRRERRSPATGRGRYVSSRPARGTHPELALAATLRAAAPHQLSRWARPRPQAAGPAPVGPGPGPRAALRLSPEDLREKVRRSRARHLILFVVDASGSMGARERMAAAKGAVLTLLREAYRRRDRVGLIAFGGQGSRLLLPPTSSVERAEACLRELPTGGRTPLAGALQLAGNVFSTEALRGWDTLPVLVLVSDGRANAAPAGVDPLEAALAAARSLARRPLTALVVDAETGYPRLGLAQRLAAALGGRCLRLAEVAPESLARTVRGHLLA